MGRRKRHTLAPLPPHHPGQGRVDMHTPVTGLYNSRHAGTSQPAAEPRRIQVRPRGVHKRMPQLQPATRRQDTSTTTRAKAIFIVVTLIDLAGWMLPCLLLNASIIYCAWANRWI